MTIGPGTTDPNCDADAFSIQINDATGEPYWNENWQSNEWVGLVNSFIAEELGDTYGEMALDQDLAGGDQVYAAADPVHSTIVYLTLGAEDKHDTGGGGDLTLNLSEEPAGDVWTGEWYDPRTGRNLTPDQSPFSGGRPHAVSPPSTEDWVLLLRRQ